jgi:hypothetical protein|tara:strand:- start:181 stop:366 length:186 start_codon:yes stop_codon:yes gene_type:complete
LLLSRGVLAVLFATIFVLFTPLGVDLLAQARAQLVVNLVVDKDPLGQSFEYINKVDLFYSV